MLGEIESTRIHILDCDDDKIVAWQPDRAFGLDSNHVLEELMGVPALNQRIKDKVHDVSHVIDDGHFTQAEELIRRLAAEVGENHPELLRLRSLIAFLTRKK